MQLFCIHVDSERIEEFVRDCYVSIHVPWLSEDVESVSWEQLCAQYGEAEKSEHVRLFVYDMQDGDLIIMTDGESVYLGDLGDYFFVAEEKGAADIEQNLPPCLHRRGVTWLKSLGELMSVMAPELRQFIEGTVNIAKYPDQVSLEAVDMLLNQSASFPKQSHEEQSASVFIDDELISEAIEVLKLALRSDDVERRERAAIALLNFAKK